MRFGWRLSVAMPKGFRTLMSSGPFSIPEHLVVSRTGLTRAEVKKRRGVEGQDWQRTAAGVMWSETGLENLLQALGGPESSQKNAPAVPSVPDPEIFTVASLRTENRILVTVPGVRFDPAKPVTVKLPLPNAHLFVPGMRLLARRVPGHDLWLEYVGNPDPQKSSRRWPRAKGRW